MIPGFEEFTEDVTSSELEAINMIANGLNARVGVVNAITNAEARKMLYINKGVNVSDPKFRKFIQYIRAYNLCPMLCASSKGYWIAKDREEYIKYREAFSSRVRAMKFTESCMFHFDMENNVLK